jgi:hypothetical protein
MSLTYKNTAKTHILHNLRNIRYANTEMLFGFYNTLEIELELVLSPEQIFFQADVFAREILTHRSQFDLKRFLGSYQEDWLRILSEAYVYDRLKSIYYGVNSKYMMEFPSNITTFPGNVLLANLLAKQSFSFSTNDSQPFNLYVKILYEDNILESFQPIFDISPDLKEGMSDVKGIYSYVNSRYESVLKGLYNAKLYLESRNDKSKFSSNSNNINSKNSSHSLFQIGMLDDDNIKAFVIGEDNPILNSFLSKGFDKFYFIMPVQDSVPEALRFNESLFISRALGFTGKQLNISGNAIYTSAIRHTNDAFVREEVYSITGLKTEMVPYSMEQIRKYLSINSYIKDDGSNGGIDTSSP